MSCKVISFMNMKGGVGKTTLCVNIAQCISKYKGKKVLIIDIDPQSNTSQYILGKEKYKEVIENSKTIFSIYDEICQDDFNYSAVTGNVIEEEEETNKEIFVEIDEKFHILPGDLRLVRLSQGVDPSTVLTLKNYLELNKLYDKYNYIFIDCPPTQSIYTSSALMVSDYYVLPVKPDFLSSIGIDIMKNIVKKHNRTSPKKVKCLGIIFNMVHKNDYEKTIMEQVRQNNIMDTFSEYINQSSNISRGSENQQYLLDIKGFKKKIKSISEEFISRAK